MVLCAALASACAGKQNTDASTFDPNFKHAEADRARAAAEARTLEEWMKAFSTADGQISLYLANDNGRADGMVRFPTINFESLVRFEIPEGNHELKRLWLQAAAPGTLAISFYDLDKEGNPGKPLERVTLAVPRQAIAVDKQGKRDGRWFVMDIKEGILCKKAIWVGFKRVSGYIALWATHVDSGKYYIRNVVAGESIEMTPPKIGGATPATQYVQQMIPTTEMTPIQRTPLVRIEMSP